VNSIYAPAFWLYARVGLPAGMTLSAILFLVPTALALTAALPPSVNWAAALVLCTLACYFLAAVRMYRSRGIGGLVQLMERIASGELVTENTQGSQAGQGADIVRLQEAIMQMNRSLAAIVKQVSASAEAISMGARTIAEGNAQLSERTHSQAASLEETASGMEQLAALARQNAEHCSRANELADGAGQVAVTAASRMQEVAATMRQIDDSARRVSDILSTVEGIAFQTNILALNAAVEAARAGEHGRGFAVVASEVRALAQRSAQAAREIKDIINLSADNVQKGRGLVDATERTMKEAVAGAREVTQVIAAIAQSSRQQSGSVEEINRAIVAIDAATQQNAALVEEAASSTEDFQRESAELVRAIGRFKTDRAADRARAVALVKAGVRHVRKVGLERACRDFMEPRGGFIQGEDYLFVVDLNCRRLAFPPDPSTVGQSDWDLRDADGNYLSRQNVEIARTAGSGWNDFRVPNPVSGRIEPKSAYVERVGDAVIGCGIYRRDGGSVVQDVAAAQRAGVAYLDPSLRRLVGVGKR
jgi:methyl-accepting chemotaxis protein